MIKPITTDVCNQIGDQGRTLVLLIFQGAGKAFSSENFLVFKVRDPFCYVVTCSLGDSFGVFL